MTVNNLLIRDRIRQLAKKKKMSLPDLEKALGFGSSTISHWNKAIPGIDKLLLVSDYLEVSLDYLVRGFDFVPNSPASEVEYELIEMYRQLNQEGQRKLQSYAEDLVASGRYIYEASGTQDH